MLTGVAGGGSVATAGLEPEGGHGGGGKMKCRQKGAGMTWNIGTYQKAVEFYEPRFCLVGRCRI